MTAGDDDTARDASAVVARASRARRTLAVAESLTGGLVTARLTDVPGASRVLRGAVVAYATDLKASLLGVDRRLLSARGAVDADVARAMADGVRAALRADVGLATTGAAGPTGQDGKPPGTVHVAVTWTGGALVRSEIVAGPREVVRERAVELVIGLLLDSGALDEGLGAQAGTTGPGATLSGYDMPGRHPDSRGRRPGRGSHEVR